MNRLTDNDKTFGPFTFARVKWKRISAIYSSGDNYEGVKCPNTLTIYAFGWIVRVALPSILKPFAQKVIATGWDQTTIDRLGRNYYFNYFEREYGFSLSDGDFFQLYYGIQSGFGNLPEGVEEQSWCKHLPWKQWNHVRYSIYKPDGEHYWTEPKREKGKPVDFDSGFKAKDDCPKTHYLFEDYDGQKITATCMITEREWHKGEGSFKWLKYFYPAKIVRSLDLSFNAEVGPEKGSWKGGTIGHAIEMNKGETPERAFRRYCEIDHERKGKKFSLKFIQPVNIHPVGC